MSLLRSRILFSSSKCLFQQPSHRVIINLLPRNLSLLSPSICSPTCSVSSTSNLYSERGFDNNGRANLLLNYNSVRYLAKGKDRKKETKKGSGQDKPKVILDDEEMEKVYEGYEELQDEIEYIVDAFKNDLRDNFNVRLNPRQIEGIEVNYEGMKVTIADLVTVARKPNEFILNLQATPHMVKPVMQAIIDSGLNLNPQVDGHAIYIMMPKVTTEHRQQLIKGVKTLAQTAKDKLKDRNMHKKYMVKDTKKLSKDLLNDAQANLNYLIRQKSTTIDEIAAQKVDSLTNN